MHRYYERHAAFVPLLLPSRYHPLSISASSLYVATYICLYVLRDTVRKRYGYCALLLYLKAIMFLLLFIAWVVVLLCSRESFSSVLKEEMQAFL